MSEVNLFCADTWWFELIEALRGKRVPFWSRETGLSDESFVVADVSQDGVLLEGGIPISRFEIFRIWARYPKYMAGIAQPIPRRLISENTPYILSLLHYLQSNQTPGATTIQ